MDDDDDDDDDDNNNNNSLISEPVPVSRDQVTTVVAPSMLNINFIRVKGTLLYLTIYSALFK